MATSTRSAPDPSGRRRRPPERRGTLGTPLLLLNLKAYPESVGPAALPLGRLLQRLGERLGVPTAVAASAPDLGTLARSLTIPVLAQHADDVPPGARTGWMVPAALHAAGVKGSLLGHSEHPLPDRDLPGLVRRLRTLGLASVICAGEDRQAIRRARQGHPDYLAVEPPELIGGHVSVSAARPEIITRSVRGIRRASRNTRVLCGAGIHNGEDVRRALELGAEGVLLASAVTLSPAPGQVLRDLLSGFSRR